MGAGEGHAECARLLRLPWENIRRVLARWRRYARLVGRFAKHVPEWHEAWEEVRYRPDGSGCLEKRANFESCAARLGELACGLYTQRHHSTARIDGRLYPSMYS